MNFENNPSLTNFSTPKRKLEIIVVKDNRQSTNQEKASSELKHSAFKGSVFLM